MDFVLYRFICTPKYMYLPFGYSSLSKVTMIKLDGTSGILLVENILCPECISDEK
jgi:hypothetical protein